MRIAWTAPLPDFPEGPLVADGHRLFVAARDGSLLALDLNTGERAWRLPNLPGRPAASEGAVLVRQASGRVSSLQAKDGTPRWTVDSGVGGDVPPVIDGDRVFIAGRGVAALELASGRVVWKAEEGPGVTALPLVAGPRVYVGEADGTLRARDRETGRSIWSFPTASALAAPPVVDGRERLFLGTTDRRIVAIRAKDGHREWRWKVGADVQAPGVVFRNRVVFAAFDAVLYGLDRAHGSQSWRAPLPSRPIGGPVLVDEAALVACHETEVLGFDLRTGKPLGGLKTTAPIRTAPLVVGRRLFLGLGDRTVIALDLGTAPSP